MTNVTNIIIPMTNVEISCGYEIAKQFLNSPIRMISKAHHKKISFLLHI